MNIGETLKKKRLALGLTQKQLGEKCGMTYVSIINIEKNKMPTLKSLLKICKALELDICLMDKK